MKTTVVALLLSLISIAGVAQPKDNGQEIIDKFFELYKTGGSEVAIKYAFGTNKWINLEGDDIKNLVFELDKTLNLIGSYIGHEELRVRMAGSRFRAVSYFVYFDRQPMRFTFQLYKNNSGWQLWNFKFDSDMDSEIEAGMKLNNLE